MNKPHKSIAKSSHGHSFVRLEHRMLSDYRFMALSGNANKALLYLASQYKGMNNGDLCAVWKLAKRCGWTSNGNLQRAIAELEQAGFIIKTRQGGRNRCSLYALSWFPIDPCDNKIDVQATKVASNDWQKINLSEPRVVQCVPPVVQSSEKRQSIHAH